jgi:hypothetical protein
MALFGSIAANANFSQLTGTTAADDATAGNVGEIITSTVAIGAGPSLSTGSPSNVTNISLTAGDWDVSGEVVFEFTSATQSGDSIAALSPASATLNGDIPDGYNGLRLTTTTCKTSIALAPQRFSQSGTLTRYLVAQATFSAGSCKASGIIRARRIR